MKLSTSTHRESEVLPEHDLFRRNFDDTADFFVKQWYPERIASLTVKSQPVLVHMFLCSLDEFLVAVDDSSPAPNYDCFFPAVNGNGNVSVSYEVAHLD